MVAPPVLNIPRGRVRGERLETRVTADQKSIIEHAAALQGRTVTDFVMASVLEAARHAIEERQRLDLSVRDSQAFVDALINLRPTTLALSQPEASSAIVSVRPALVGAGDPRVRRRRRSGSDHTIGGRWRGECRAVPACAAPASGIARQSG